MNRRLLSLILLVAFAAPTAKADTNQPPAIADLPHTTLTKSGRAGDLINVGLVGDRSEIIAAMTAAGWYPSDPVTVKTSLKITGSVLLRRTYKFAPISALFYQGRIQDFAFQKPFGKSAARRHHVRFWKVLDQGAEGRPIWLGSGTFDRSVGVSHTTHKITHHIAPDIDTERETIINDLVFAKQTITDYLMPGAGQVTTAKNGGGDPYFSDGKIHFAVIAKP